MESVKMGLNLLIINVVIYPLVQKIKWKILDVNNKFEKKFFKK